VRGTGKPGGGGKKQAAPRQPAVRKTASTIREPGKTAALRGRRVSERSQAETPPAERLQKVLAEAGLGSRREIERWIEQGRVRVEGVVAELGAKVTPKQKIQVDDRLITVQRKAVLSRVIVLNKSAGTICTRSDPEGRPTVFEDLPSIPRGRWVVVGRLDAMTTGLLLFTDDGDLAHRLMHPSSMLDREYAVRIDGKLTDEEMATLRNGVTVEGETMRFTDIRHYDGRGRNHWYHVVLMEGKQHEVKLLFGAIERIVSRLKRVRFGPVILPSRLVEGRFEELAQGDVNQLRNLVGLAPGPTTAKEGRQKTVLLAYPSLEERLRTATTG
jgi:23S rRNA pseudouridine2605 synthase